MSSARPPSSAGEISAGLPPLAVMTAAIEADSLWFLNFGHVMAGVLAMIAIMSRFATGF